jgi:hypothetical protein
MLRDAAEPGLADTLAGDGLGLAGGDFGGAGENLGQQVQQMRAFVAAEGGQDALLQVRSLVGQRIVGEFAPVGGCRARRAPISRGEPCSPALPRGVDGTQARSAGESVVTSGSGVTASAAASSAGNTVVGIVPFLPCRFRSNSTWQFMLSTGGAGVEATNRAPTGHLAVLAAA